MAGPRRPPSKKRATFSPKAKSKPAPGPPARPPAPAAPPRAAVRRPQALVPPRRAEAEPERDLIQEAQAGASGRAIGRSSSASVPAAAPVEPDRDPGVSPFAQYTDGVEMAGHLERGRADTVQVVAIMAGLLFVVGSAMVLSGAVVFAGLAWTGTLEGVTAAGDGTDDPTHIRDTGIVRRGVIEAPQTRRRTGGGAAPAPDAAPVVEAPQPAPVTVIIQGGVMFHEVEVSCPSGWRGRSRVSGDRSTVKDVPPNMECRLTFKGGVPAQTKVYAGQTISCSFTPLNCSTR
ncbi:MAG: hypothetical protein ACI8PZ_002664 [Myxococcota bacterium]|jgi:hypothetical protein